MKGLFTCRSLPLLAKPGEVMQENGLCRQKIAEASRRFCRDCIGFTLMVDPPTCLIIKIYIDTVLRVFIIRGWGGFRGRGLGEERSTSLLVSAGAVSEYDELEQTVAFSQRRAVAT